VHHATFQPVQPENLHQTFDLFQPISYLHMFSCTLLFMGLRASQRRTDVVLTFSSPLFVGFNKVHPCGWIVCSDSWMISRCDLWPHSSHLCQHTVWLFFPQTRGWMLQLFFVSFTCWWTDNSVFLFKNNSTLVSSCSGLSISIYRWWKMTRRRRQWRMIRRNSISAT